MIRPNWTLSLVLFTLAAPALLCAADPAPPAEVEPLPTIFLDKNPRIIAYQLAQLSNKQIVRLERKDTDAKYKPIYEAILTRPGLEAKHRTESLNALIKLNKSDAAAELLGAIRGLDEDANEETQAARQNLMRDFANQLMRQKPEALAAKRDALTTLATDAGGDLAKQIAYAALLQSGGDLDQTWQSAGEKDGGTRLLLGGAAYVRDGKVLADLRPKIIETIDSASDDALRDVAADALSYVPGREPETAALLASLVLEGRSAIAAALALRRVPSQHWPKDKLVPLAGAVVKMLEEIPTDERTSPRAIDVLQFGYELASRLSESDAAALRKQLRALGVQVVLLKAPLEQMIYDQKWFAVEAGKPVQVIFANTDAMPHNFVVVKPGALEEIGTAAELLQPSSDPSVMPYVPPSEKVMHAMKLVQPGDTGRLSFTAPTAPGEYPFVCTFPGHWRRMYGVMVVVKDLDAFAKSPVEPKDPLGNTRKLVKEWKVDDLKPLLATLDKGRDAARGKAVFAEAGCVLCHRVQAQGGQVGPELTEVFKKWKGVRADVLTEILEPSKVIDDKFRPYLMETAEGDRLTALIVGEEGDSLLVITNPNRPEPVKMKKDDIVDRRKLSTSMMPAGLLNLYTPDEILDLLAYLEAGGKVPAHEHKHE